MHCACGPAWKERLEVQLTSLVRNGGFCLWSCLETDVRKQLEGTACCEPTTANSLAHLVLNQNLSDFEELNDLLLLHI